MNSKHLIVGTSFVGSLLLVLIVGTSTGIVVAEDGKAIFDGQKCATCHSVEALGIEAKTKSAAMKGADLSTVDLDAELIGKYLRKQEKINDKDHKKEIKIGDDEMASLVEWLRSDKS